MGGGVGAGGRRAVNGMARLVSAGLQLRLAELQLGVEVEEGVEAAFELGFDLFAGAFDGVHGDVGQVAVGEFEGCVLNFSDFTLGQEPESVDECEVGHECHDKEESRGVQHGVRRDGCDG